MDRPLSDNRFILSMTTRIKQGFRTGLKASEGAGGFWTSSDGRNSENSGKQAAQTVSEGLCRGWQSLDCRKTWCMEV